MADVRKVVEDYQRGILVKEIAAKHGISRFTIPNHLKRFGVKPRRRSRMRATSLSPSIRKRIAAEYANGGTTTALAEKYKVSTRFIKNSILLVGAKMRFRKHFIIPAAMMQKAADAYRSGAKVERAARLAGISECFVYKCLKRFDVPIRGGNLRRHLLNESAFDSLTDEAAYWIGFLMTDGCVQENIRGANRISVCQSATDKNHLLKFRSFLGASHKISRIAPSFKSRVHQGNGRYANINSGAAAIFTVHSRKLAVALGRYGVVPRKTHIAKARGGVEKLASFWRGCVDGDGWVSMSFKRKASSHWRCWIGLCGASLSLLKQFLRFVKTHAPNFKGKIHKRRGLNFYSVVATDRNALPLIRAMYGNDGPSLTRKKQIANRALLQSEKNPFWCQRRLAA